MTKGDFLGRIAVALAIGSCVPVTFAAWPEDQPIKIIVPQVPGGTNDTIARLVAVELGRALKQSVIVDNRPGAAGAIGMQAVLQARPDGYTLGLASDSAALLNVVRSKLSFRFPQDLAAIGMIGQQPISVAVSAKSPYRSFAELVDYGRKHPGEINYGSSGIGTNQHVLGEWLAKLTGAQFTHIPYKGGGQATADLLGGQVPMAVLGLAPMLAQEKAGTVRIVAVSTAKRDPAVPQVPTLAELGYPQIALAQWAGLVGPKKTPPAVLERLSNELQKALTNSQLQRQLIEAGMQPHAMPAAEFNAFVDQNARMWAGLVPSLHLKLE
jgi:tripartite-type tricarboxylate transporter receptor subunit TctC